MRQREAAVFESVDFLAFHWHSYGEYAVQRYRISGANLFRLDWGCRLGARARFSDPLRLVYLGSLSSRFIDLPLLSRLQRRYPHIDVYGAPAPDPELGLNYRGFATPAVLASYQLGVITCTKDDLRRHGFSAKHLEYLSHALPVLVPSWRTHSLQGSLAYDEDSFLEVIERLSDEREWQHASDLAYDQASRLTWEKTLEPLAALTSAS
jgi:hypothetical protein